MVLTYLHQLDPEIPIEISLWERRQDSFWDITNTMMTVDFFGAPHFWTGRTVDQMNSQLAMGSRPLEKMNH